MAVERTVEMSGMNIFLLVLAGLIGLFGLVSLGFLLSPRPFRPHTAPTHLGEPLPLDPNLPEPVRRHFRETLGEQVPRLDTAVVWGRGRICVRGVWLPQRFKTFYRAGGGFYRRVERTFYMRPVMREVERYLARQEGTAGPGEGSDGSQALELWAEMVWLPAVFVLGEPARWEALDEHSARLFVPGGPAGGLLTAHFDPLSGRMTDLQGTRYSEESGEEEPWRIDLLTWKAYHGLLLPEQVVVAWGESGSPTAYWSVDGVAYNVNVNDHLGEAQK